MRKIFTLLSVLALSFVAHAQTWSGVPYATGFETNETEEVWAATGTSVAGQNAWAKALADPCSWQDMFGGTISVKEYTTTLVADAYSGSQALKFYLPTSATIAVKLRSYATGLTAGDVYTISFYAKTDAEGAALNGGQLISANNNEYPALTTSYAKYSFEYTMQGNGRFFIWFKDASVLGSAFNVWIDDLTIEKSTATAIGDEIASEVVFYPNPVQDVINVMTDAKVNKVEVFSLTGQKVLGDYTGSKQVNVAGLSKGVYIVSVEADGQTLRRKVTKQ